MRIGVPGEFHEAQKGYYPIHQLIVAPRGCHWASVGGVVVPKTGQKNALPREDAPEVPVGRVPVPKCR